MILGRWLVGRTITVAFAACLLANSLSCATGDRPEYRTVAERFVSALASRDTSTLHALVVPERVNILLQGLPEPGDRRLLAAASAPVTQYRGSKDGRSNYFLHAASASDVGVWVLLQQSPSPRVYSYQLVPDLGP